MQGTAKRAPCDRSDRDRPSSRLTWRRARIDAAFGATAIGLHESVALPRPLPLAQVLERDASLAGWSERARFEARLTGVLRAHLPRAVGPHVRVAGTDANCLELAAGAGAIAATLRQRAPDLLAALRREGLDFTEIRVRVQVAGVVGATPKPPSRQWDSRDATPLFELADRLPDGPLKAALAQWSRRARGR